MSSLFQRTPLQQAFAALRSDLIHGDGPRISTMRNYRFAIVPYDPRDEFRLREHVHRLGTELREHGWFVLTISLQALLLERVRAQGPDWAERVAAMEARLARRSGERGVNYLKNKLAPLIEGADGIAADVARIIGDHARAHPEQVDRTVAFVGRAGALFPFFRSSALLRHVDGRTGNIPVILLYPGERRGQTGLSFMGVLDPDNDYRPRIYP